MYVLFAQYPSMIVDCCVVGQTRPTIDMLPGYALIYVFDFYVAQASEVEAWHTLVVFGSPRRLNLQIKETQVKEKLDAWTALPIVISGYRVSSTGIDNVKAALDTTIVYAKSSFVLPCANRKRSFHQWRKHFRY